MLDKLHLANKKYRETLSMAEIAYKNRYGQSPDNDLWIDSFHLGVFPVTVEQLDDSVYNMPDKIPE